MHKDPDLTGTPEEDGGMVPAKMHEFKKQFLQKTGVIDIGIDADEF